MPELVLDVFEGDAFSFVSLTDSINNLPFTPGRLGEMGLFSESGIVTIDIELEYRDGYLSLISPTERGGPGETRPKLPRGARKLVTSHFQIDDTIKAEEVQGVREFGTPTQMRTVESYLASRMGEVTPNFDATLEHQRVGALKGIITDKNSNVVYDLYSEFGISKPADVKLDLSPTAKLRPQLAKVARDMARSLGGISMRGIGALVGDDMWDSLITHPDVEKTYMFQAGAVLRQGIEYRQLDFGDIFWENYKGYVPKNDGTGNVTPFIDTNAAQLYPMGVPNFFRTVFGPADYLETVNTVGLPRYAKFIPFRNNKGGSLEMQTNPLSYCTRPGVLRKMVAQGIG